MAEIAKLFASIGAETSAFEKALKGVDRDLNVASKGFSQLQDTVTTGFKVMAGAAVAAGAAIAAGLVGAVKAASDVQQQAANISAVFGDIAPPVQEVKDLMSELALNPNLVVGMGEVGGIIEELAKAGADWEAISGGMAEKTVLLANATGADFTLAATVASDAMALFNLKGEDMNRVLAGAVGVANKSKFGLEDYAYVLANLGPTAASLGIPIETMNALIAMTASSFTSGRTAGTSWSLLLQNLAPQSEKAADAMKELGLMTEEGGNAFFDANGQLKDMDQVMSLLQGAFGGLTQEQQINYSRTIFGREAYGALMAILQMNTAELGAMTAAMTDMDAVMESAETRTGTFDAAWGQFQDTITALRTQIGEEFLPGLERITRWATEFITTHTPQVVEWFGRIAAVLELGYAWLLEWIETGNMFGDAFDQLPDPIRNAILTLKGFIDIVGHVIRSIGEFVGQFVTWEDVWTAFALLITGVVIAAIGQFIASISPLLLVIGGAIAAVAALRTAWENDWLGLRSTFEPIVDFLVFGFGVLRNAFWAAIADGKITSEEFSAMWRAATAYVEGALRILWDYVKTAFNGIRAETVGFVAAVDQEIQALTGGFITLQDVVLGLAIAVGGPLVKSFVVSAVGAIKAFLVAAAPWAGWIAAVIVAVAALRLAWETDWMGIRTAFEPVIGVIQRGLGLLQLLFADVMADGKITTDELQRMWDATKIVLQRVFGAIWDAGKEVFDNIKDKVVEFGNKAWEEFSVRFPKTAETLEQAFETAKTGIGKAMDYLQDRFGPLGDAIRDFGVESLKEIGKWATGQETEFEATGKIWETARDTFSVVMGDMKNVVVEFGDTAWNEFSTRFPKTAAELEKRAGEMRDKIKQIYADLSTGTKSVGDILYEEFAVRFPRTAGTMTTEIAEISAAWKDFRDTFMLYVDDIKQSLGILGAANQQARIGFTDEWGFGVEELDRLFTIMGTVVSTGIQTILGILKTRMQLALGDWSGAWETMKETAWTLLGGIGTVIQHALGIILGSFGVDLDALIVRWKQVWTEVKTVAQEAWTQIKDEMWTLVIKPLIDFGRDSLQYGRDIIGGLLDGMRQKWTELTTWWSGVWPQIQQKLDMLWIFGSPSKWMKQRGQWVVEGFAQGIDASKGQAFSAMDSLTSGIMARANALEISLDGTVTQIAGKITALQNHQAALKKLEDVGAQQIATYMADLPKTTGGTGSATTPSAAVQSMASGSIVGWAAQFAKDAASYAGSLSYDAAVSAGLVGQAYRDAYHTLTDDKPDTEAALIQAIYTLINALKAAPGGNQFQINMAASQTGNVQQDLANAVQYFRALYAS